MWVEKPFPPPADWRGKANCSSQVGRQVAFAIDNPWPNGEAALSRSLYLADVP